MTEKFEYRKDNNGHKFKLPAILVSRFDEVFDKYCKAKDWTDERFDLEAVLDREFRQYMVG